MKRLFNFLLEYKCTVNTIFVIILCAIVVNNNFTILILVN
jgi:hypothetical protein